MTETVTLQIADANTMTQQQRKDVAAWLTDQAHALVMDGGEYAPHYTGRYYTEDRKER